MKLPLHQPHPSEAIEHIESLEGVRVALVNVPVREQSVANVAPQGPALLAARLEALGADVAILDLNAKRPVHTREQARRIIRTHAATHAPHLWGLSGLITTLAWQTDIATYIREAMPDTAIVSGGGLATQFRERLLQWIPQLDGIGHSEGDDIIVRMAWDAKHGKVAPVYHGDRPLDLDALPFPAWHLLPDIRHYIAQPIWGDTAGNSSAAPFSTANSLNTVSSRGCPFACKFCFRGAQGERNYGVRSAENLAAEMRWLVEQYGVEFVGCLDDNFMVQPNRLRCLPGCLPRVAWGTHGRLDEAADAARVAHMAESGCKYIGFGAESASPRTLEAMGKGGHMLSRGTEDEGGYEVPRTMLDGVRNAHVMGVHANCTWIMGYPGETLDDLKHTIAFILWQEDLVGHPVNRSLFVATAYPGTEMWRHPHVQKLLGERFGITAEHDDALRCYVLQLNDATKTLVDEAGNPLNFGAMPDSQFMQVRELVEAGELERIMGL